MENQCWTYILKKNKNTSLIFLTLSSSLFELHVCLYTSRLCLSLEPNIATVTHHTPSPWHFATCFATETPRAPLGRFYSLTFWLSICVFGSPCIYLWVNVVKWKCHGGVAWLSFCQVSQRSGMAWPWLWWHCRPQQHVLGLPPFAIDNNIGMMSPLQCFCVGHCLVLLLIRNYYMMINLANLQLLCFNIIESIYVNLSMFMSSDIGFCIVVFDKVITNSKIYVFCGLHLCYYISSLKMMWWTKHKL